MYGGASNSDLYNNTITPLNKAEFSMFRIGSAGCDECVAKNIKFRSNHIEGQKFSLDVTDQDHSYSVFWTLNIAVKDPEGLPLNHADITILNKDGDIALKTKTDASGKVSQELIEYSVEGNIRKVFSPYIITSGKIKEEVNLDSNKEITIQYK